MFRVKHLLLLLLSERSEGKRGQAAERSDWCERQISSSTMAPAKKKKVFSHNFLKCFLPLPPALNVLFRYTGGIYRPFDSALTNKAIDDSGSPKWANASEEKKTVGRSASCVRNTKRNKAQCSYKSDIDKVCVQSLEWTAHFPFE